MNSWDPQHFRKYGLAKGVPTSVLEAAPKIASNIAEANPHIPPIFTLKHFSHLTGVDYPFIRRVVTRSIQDPYNVFRIRKRGSNRYRIICVPEPGLLEAQRWIAQNVLRHAQPHVASYAFAPNKRIRDAASLHCGCAWLIKMDVRRFFESISEIATYRVFRGLGYEPLISFEIARICTRLGKTTRPRQREQWHSQFTREVIQHYQNTSIGHLPQGAPTSPMLSNLAMIGFDKAMAKIANDSGLIYTRYADDLCLSSADKNFSRKDASKIIGQTSAQMGKHGLSPNFTKTKVAPPGSRKTVLGLLVNGPEPRLSREFRARLRQHIHYLTHSDFGPAVHARNRKFASVEGMRNHIEGLIAYAHDIDVSFALQCRKDLKDVHWPFD